MRFQFPCADVEVSEREPITSTIDPVVAARLDTLRHSIITLCKGSTRDVLLGQLDSVVRRLALVE